MNRTIIKILETSSWKIALLVTILGLPIGLLHIIQLQNEGKADDIGLLYRIYCAVADVVPYAIGATAIHALLRKYRQKKTESMKS